jgi:hypothetical protein
MVATKIGPANIASSRPIIRHLGGVITNPRRDLGFHVRIFLKSTEMEAREIAQVRRSIWEEGYGMA